MIYKRKKQAWKMTKQLYLKGNQCIIKLEVGRIVSYWKERICNDTDKAGCYKTTGTDSGR